MVIVFKTIVLKKLPHFVKEFSNLTIWNGVMGQNIQF